MPTPPSPSIAIRSVIFPGAPAILMQSVCYLLLLLVPVVSRRLERRAVLVGVMRDARRLLSCSCEMPSGEGVTGAFEFFGVVWCGGGRGMEKKRATSEPSLRVGKRMHDNRNARFSSMDSVPSRSRLLDAGGSLHAVLACSHPEFTPGSINLPISTHFSPPSCPNSFFSFLLLLFLFSRKRTKRHPRQRGLPPTPSHRSAAL